MKALPKVSIYKSIIVKFIDEINSKYGMALTFTTLEPHEVGHWAETFQVVGGSSKRLKSPRPWQVQEEPCQSGRPQQTVTEWPHQQTPQPLPTITGQHQMLPQVQVQQEEINRMTNVAAQWSSGDQQRVENNYSTHRHMHTCNCSMPNMSPVVPDYNDHFHYYD